MPVFGPSAGPLAEMMKPAVDDEEEAPAPPKVAQFITPDAEELAADKSGFVIVVYLKKVKKTSADAANAEGLTPEQVKQSRIELKGGIVIVGK